MTKNTAKKTFSVDQQKALASASREAVEGLQAFETKSRKAFVEWLANANGTKALFAFYELAASYCEKLDRKNIPGDLADKCGMSPFVGREAPYKNAGSAVKRSVANGGTFELFSAFVQENPSERYTPRSALTAYATSLQTGDNGNGDGDNSGGDANGSGNGDGDGDGGDGPFGKGDGSCLG